MWTYGGYVNAAAELTLVTGHDATLYNSDGLISGTSLSDPVEQTHITAVDQTAGGCLGTHTHRYNGPLSRTTRVSRYQNMDFTEARDSEWHRHQLGQMQVCISLQTDNHTSIT